ncbi:serine hydrolase [Mycoplasmatota bacterium zrk1]
MLASITKLYTTACIMSLHKESKLSLDDKISQYLMEDILKGLHIYILT